MKTVEQMVQEYGPGIASKIVAISKLIVDAEAKQTLGTTINSRKGYNTRKIALAHALYLLCCTQEPTLDDWPHLNQAINYARSVVANEHAAQNRGGF